MDHTLHSYRYISFAEPQRILILLLRLRAKSGPKTMKMKEKRRKLKDPPGVTAKKTIDGAPLVIPRDPRDGFTSLTILAIVGQK